MDLFCERVGHRFGRQKLFAGIEFSLRGCGSLCVAGPNGSGKSTFMRILAGLLEPAAGRVSWSSGGKLLDRQQRHQSLGFVSPDLHLYGELTVLENLRFFARLRGVPADEKSLSVPLERFGLSAHAHQPYATLSSGQKQRLKYIWALLHAPTVLFLDEPTANLDVEGRTLVADVVEQQKRAGLLVVATNEEEEYRFGDTVVRLRS